MFLRPMSNTNANRISPGYELKDELARYCLPSANRDANLKLAWVNSICILFLLIGIAGARADITTKRPEKKRRGLQQIDELKLRIGQLAAEDARVAPLPSGIGDDIMRAFGLPPSRLIGEVKRALEGAVEAGEIAPQQEPEAYVEFLKANRERFGL